MTAPSLASLLKHSPHHTGTDQSVHGNRGMVLYRGEGSLDHPSYYPSTGPDADMADGWWTDNPKRAAAYAKGVPDGKVYTITVDKSEVERRGLHYFIPDPSVRERRQVYVPPRKSYHLTDNPRFELDPTYVPDQNYLAIYTREDAGIYLTDNPEYWVNAHNYVRPFVVEFEVTGDQEHAGVPGSSQEFIPADQYDRLKITRIIPLDEWAREEFGEKGWVEEHFNPTEYSIYEPYKRPFPDYKYTGPDVREMSEAETKALIDKTKRYLKEARGIDLDEEIEKRKINRTPDYPHGRSIKWPKVYRGLRRRGFSKEGAARISNAMSNKYRGGRRQPLSRRAGQKPIPEDILDKRPDLRKHMGPGPHPSGTPQSVHGSGAHGTSGTKMKQRVGPGGDLSEGFTILPITGEPATSGFAVAIKGNEKRIPGDEITPDIIAAFRREAWDLFSDIEGAHWGGWYDTKNDVYVFDVSVVLDDAEEAVKLGRENDQDAIFDLTNFEEIRTDDDGTSFEEWKARHS